MKTMRDYHKLCNTHWNEGFRDGLIQAKQMLEGTVEHGRDRSALQIKLDRLIRNIKVEA